eukprot:15366229-Ditylum_brightwellii.AAC.2
MSMPRSPEDKSSAFFSVGINNNSSDIIAMCVPNLSNIAKQCAGVLPHYVKAYLNDKGAPTLINKLLTPEAISTSNEYRFDLTTLELIPTNPEHPTFASGYDLAGFDNVNISHQSESKFPSLTTSWNLVPKLHVKQPGRASS